MVFLAAHRLLLGLAADVFALVGALVLTIEAFGRLRDLTSNRVQQDFDQRYPGLPLVDQEAAAARRVVLRAYIGCGLMVAGFILQALTRIAESRCGTH